MVLSMYGSYVESINAIFNFVERSNTFICNEEEDTHYMYVSTDGTKFKPSTGVSTQKKHSLDSSNNT